MFIYDFSFDSCYFLLTMFFVFPNGFADKNDVVPNFGLVNQPSLDKILKGKVFVHSDGQLKAGTPNSRLHPHIQKLLGAEVCNQSKRFAPTPNKCCYLGFPHC